MNIRINDIVNNTLNNTVAGGMNNGLYNGTGIRRNTRRMPKPMILLIGMLFMAVGVFLIVKTVHNNRVLTAETTAVITEIREEVTTSHDTNSNKAVIEVNSKPKTRTYYYPSIKYTIDGQTYYNDLSTGSSDPDAYRVGNSINIRYNPAKPTEIDLGSTSTKSSIFMALGCMIAGIIAGIAFIKVR